MFEVLLSETASKQLQDIPGKLKQRLKTGLAVLADDPFRPRPRADIKRLKGPSRDYYRLRIGEYRAIYVVEGKRVLVARILPRSKAYEWLE